MTAAPTAAGARSAPPADNPRAARPAHPFVGTLTMLSFVLRRNWVRLAVWFAVIVGLFGYVASYFTALLDTQLALDNYAAVSNVPSIKALTGLAADPGTLGGAVWTKIWMSCTIMLAFAAAFLVTRNGRAEEEDGRTELLRSRVLGVHAASVASYASVAALCVGSGVGVAVLSVIWKLDPQGGINGSLIMGASISGIGLVALGFAALAGQVASTGRGANTLASSALGVCYAIRVVGDLGDGRLTWLSPIGWGEKMAAYGSNTWWPVGLMIGLAAGLVGLALTLESRRDLASGLLPDRAGPARAHALLTTPVGLACRLQRGSTIGWATTIILSAALFGSVANAMSSFLADAASPITRILGGSGMTALVSMLVMLLAMVVGIFALHSTMQLRAEESSGILEIQLASPLSRIRWALSRLAIPVVGSLVLLGLGGVATGASYGATVGDLSQIWTIAAAELAYWPAILALVGVGVLLFGFLPRQSTAIMWALLALCWLLVMVGDTLSLPSWVLNVNPFAATPYLPMDTLNWTPIIVLGLVAILASAAGLNRFQRRDLMTG